MRRRLIYALLGLVLLLALGARWRSAAWVNATGGIPRAPSSHHSSEALHAQATAAAPMCPWRDPDADLRAFFPTATRQQTATLILSGVRPELARRLGRTPSADENALYLHRVYRADRLLGSIMTRRAKGEFGAIEIVVATDAQGVAHGLHYQRLREPPGITAALRAPRWLQAFQGKRADDDWQLGADLPTVPAEAQVSAQAVVDAVRSLLILQQTAEQSGTADTDSSSVSR